MNLYFSLSGDKNIALKSIYSYLYGYQANQLTEAFANLCDYYASYCTMHELFQK